MRSYYEHLASLKPSPEKKPILRSSAIFPALHSKEMTTRILFLNYWKLKRKLANIHSNITLRDENGEILKQHSLKIDSARAYEVLLDDLIPLEEDFQGTLEIEFLSEQNLVFPYPAVAVNYFGPHFSTVVHTAQRTFNNEEDQKTNSESHVPESGCTLYSDDLKTPFIALINGDRLAPEQSVACTFYNLAGEKLEQKIHFGSLKPYQMKMIEPDLKQFLSKGPGTIKLDFYLSGIFPRLLAGNHLKEPEASVITHTYYDCSKTETESNFWTPKNPDWHEANLMIPMLGGTHTTTLDFYPIFAPSPFSLDLELYDQQGKLLFSKPSILEFPSHFDQFKQVRLDTLYPSKEILGARIIAKPLSDAPIPARIKLALDIGIKGKGLPCNICTNLQPYVPDFTDKPTSFKWAPVLADQPKAWSILMHSSPAIALTQDAEITLQFFRKEDEATLTRHIKIPPHGYYLIDLKTDHELHTFFGSSIGWFTALSSSPYLTTFYFAENPSGVVGGGHGF